MQALLCKQFGPPESLVVENTPAPTPGPNQVLIRVEAAGVNFPDTLIIQNKYQYKPELPFSPGGEFAGVVESVGSEVNNYNAGDRVIAFTAWGAFAELVVADAIELIPMPDGLDFVTASAFVMTYGTSYYALKGRADIQPGETLLVLGASGGVGLAAIELGKAMGARVIAAASTAAKLEICRQHGADELINYREIPEWQARVLELTDGNGVDVTIETGGGGTLEKTLEATRIGGTISLIGVLTGGTINPTTVMRKSIRLQGVYVGSRRMFEDMNAALALNRIHPLIDQVFDFEDARAAYHAMRAAGHFGKLVVKI